MPRDLLGGGGSSGGGSRGRRDLLGGSGAPGRGRKKKHGGGFFGALGHVIGQGAEDIYHTAIDAPGGVYQLGAAGVHDVGKLVTDLTHGGRGGWQGPVQTEARKLADEPYQTPAIAQQIVVQPYEDIRHPLRHPGYTLLDVLPFVNVAARAAEVGRIVKSGASVGAALEKPTGPLILRGAMGVTVAKPLARSAFGRLAQRTIVDLRNRFPDTHLGFQTQTQRVARGLERQREVGLTLATAPAKVLLYKGRKIRKFSPEGRALRMVAEGTTPADVIRTIRVDLADATGSTRKNLERQLKLAEDAKQYIRVEAGRPVLTDPKLQEIYDLQHAVSQAADVTEAKAGLAAPETLTAAIQKPGRVYRGATYEATGLTGAEDFAAGQHYVGQRYAPTKLQTITGAQAGQRNVVNVGRRIPSRLTHALTGQSIHGGRVRHDTPVIIANNAVEAEKTAAAIRAAQDLYNNVAQDTPEGLKNPVAIRPVEDFNKTLPPEVRRLVDLYKSGATLDSAQTGVFGLVWEGLRAHVFPKVNPDVYFAPTADELTGATKWIERDLLGSLNAPPPLATFQQYKAGRLLLRFADAVNNAERIAILYLKPAYVVPNVVGNSFLTLTQQGLAAPGNIAAAARMMRRLGVENTILVDQLMGEGLTGALASEQGVLHGLATFAAGKYGKVIDVPFRRASFVYEARKELGLRGLHMKITKREATEFARLLNDAAMRDRLTIVVDRANRALIDYSDLTPFERAIIRRVLFFYPWLKGSTKYAADYIKDHPNQAALLSILGQQGEELQQSLGPLPSWAQAEGLFPVGGSQQFPLVVNPTSAGILGQPAQLAAEIASYLGLTPRGSGYEARQSLTPLLDALLTSLSGKNTFGADVPTGIGTFGKELYAGAPALTLAQRLTQDQTGRTFPSGAREALLQFLVGGVAPRTADRRKLNRSAELEKHGVGITVLP